MCQIETDKRHILKKSVDRANGNELSTNWTSIYIAAILSFIGSVQFSLYFSALWPYIQILDHGTSETFFGITVALYSFGQIISSPLFGIWANYDKRVRNPLCAGLILMLMGNALYILMETIFVFPKRYILLISRFIIGMGSGNVAILRTYASTASTSEDRTKAISYCTSGQALGMVFGPIFQLFFTSLEYPGYRLLNTLSLNLYTLPAFLACLMNIGGLVMLFCLFVESYAGIEDEPSKENDDQSSITSSEVSTVPSYDKLAAFICYLTRFTDMFTRTCFEVLASPLAMMFFALNESNAVTVISISQSIVGGLTLVVYILFIFFKLERYIQLRHGCIAALFAMASFYLLTFSYPFLPNKVVLTSELNSTDDAIGCNSDHFDWCENLTTVNLYYFYGVYALIIGLSFPVLTITMNSLFSKILGARRQGKEQGILQASSAFARMIGPLSTSALYTTFGPRPVWLLQIGVITVTLITWAASYKRMVPMRVFDKSEINSISSKITKSNSKNKIHPV